MHFQSQRSEAPSDGSRASQFRILLANRELTTADLDDPQRDRAWAALVADAILARDRPALRAAQEALQTLHAAQLAAAAEEPGEALGRTLGLLNVVDWASRRVNSERARLVRVH